MIIGTYKWLSKLLFKQFALILTCPISPRRCTHLLCELFYKLKKVTSVIVYSRNELIKGKYNWKLQDTVVKKTGKCWMFCPNLAYRVMIIGLFFMCLFFDKFNQFLCHRCCLSKKCCTHQLKQTPFAWGHPLVLVNDLFNKISKSTIWKRTWSIGYKMFYFRLVYLTFYLLCIPFGRKAVIK